MMKKSENKAYDEQINANHERTKDDKLTATIGLIVMISCSQSSLSSGL